MVNPRLQMIPHTPKPSLNRAYEEAKGHALLIFNIHVCSPAEGKLHHQMPFSVCCSSQGSIYCENVRCTNLDNRVFQVKLLNQVLPLVLHWCHGPLALTWS